MERAASNYRDGEVIGFDTLAKLVTPDLAYVVEVERLRAKNRRKAGRDACDPAGDERPTTRRRHVENRPPAR